MDERDTFDRRSIYSWIDGSAIYTGITKRPRPCMRQQIDCDSGGKCYQTGGCPHPLHVKRFSKASKEHWWCPLPIHGWIWPWLSALNLRLVGLRQLPAGNGRRTKQRLRAPDFSAQLRLLFANRAKQKQKQNNSGGLHSSERFKHFNIFTYKQIVNLVLMPFYIFSISHLAPLARLSCSISFNGQIEGIRRIQEKI